MILQYPTYIGDPNERHDCILQHDGHNWLDCQLSGVRSRCALAALLAHLTGHLVRSSWGAVQVGRHHTPANQGQLRGVTTQLAASGRGGRHHHFTTGAGALRSTWGRAGVPVVHFTRTARETAPLTWGNGQPEAITVSPAHQEPSSRGPGWFSSHNLGQPAPTARASHSWQPDWGQSRFSLPPRGQNLQGCLSKQLPFDARHPTTQLGY